MERVVKNDLLNGYNLIYFGLVDSDERRLDTRDSSNLQVRLTGRSEDGKGVVGGLFTLMLDTSPLSVYRPQVVPRAAAIGSGDLRRRR